MAELRLRYHHQLEVIEGKVIQLFALVAEGLVAATEALLSGDTEVARLLTEREDLIDELYLETETLVNNQLALQAPAAGDLRFLLSVLRIVPELERSHDLVEHIARRAGHGLREELSPRARGLVEQLGTVGAEMWRQAADSWYERDGRAGARLAERDEEVDDLHAALTAELGSGRMTLPVAMDMALVARFYERLGDHAVNIARRVEYLAGPSAGDEPARRAGRPFVGRSDPEVGARPVRGAAPAATGTDPERRAGPQATGTDPERGAGPQATGTDRERRVGPLDRRAGEAGSART